VKKGLPSADGMDILAARPSGTAFMKPLKGAFIAGFAFVLMASFASAGALGGFETFPKSQATMTLGGTGDSFRIAPDAPDTPDLQIGDSSALSRIDLTAIPEPPVYILLGLGLLVCAQRVMRRRRASK
jgi:hypothetical protein